MGEPCPTLRGHSLCGGTARWNAVHASARLKLRRFTGSKALVILSDGNDTGSTYKLKAALEEVQRADAAVYAVQYPDPVAALISNRLSVLTEQTGGVLFRPPGTDYGEILSRIESDLRSRYILGFRPLSEEGSHELKVEVTRPGV